MSMTIESLKQLIAERDKTRAALERVLHYWIERYGKSFGKADEPLMDEINRVEDVLMESPISSSEIIRLVRELEQNDGAMQRRLTEVLEDRAAIRAALERFVEVFQPHVMEERCEICKLAWQNAREILFSPASKDA